MWLGPVLPGLGCRQAAAAPIRPLAWEQEQINIYINTYMGKYMAEKNTDGQQRNLSTGSTLMWEVGSRRGRLGAKS